MTNGQLVRVANIMDDQKVKAKLSQEFRDWCKKHERTPLSENTLNDWMNEEQEVCEC